MPNIPLQLNKEITDKYSVDNNTFLQVAKANPKDKIDVEIGDSKQADFLPQVKIQRWDNEVNYSVRLIHDEKAPTVTTEGDKILWKGDKVEAHFYDFADSPEHPEGAYEMEVVLNKQPKTNVVQFSLNDKGVEYFYQPALTQQEIDDGTFRPENVVGSYAVYASEQKTNYVGGKEYKTGKVGHIFRPKIIDSAGTEVWGELNITDGLMAITIPQSFLDTAVYPVVVDPTFGNKTAQATNVTWGASSSTHRMRGTKGIPASSGTISSISIYAEKGTGSAMPIIAGIYVRSGETKVGGSTNATTVNSTKQWWTLTYTSPPSITVSTEYYVVSLHQNDGSGTTGSGGWFYDAGSTGDGVGRNDLATTLPDPLAGAEQAYLYSMYATYIIPVATGYSYYRSITIDHTKVPNTDQASFPVLVSLSDATLKDAAHSGHVQSSSGYDIQFSASNTVGSQALPHEIESYDNVNGVLVAWVNVPSVSHTSDTVFYMFYGNSGVTTNTSDPIGVWSAYQGVWHMDEDPSGSAPQFKDSTSNGNNMTVAGSSSMISGDLVTGQISKSIDFTNSNQQYAQYAATSVNLGGGSAGTVSCWFNEDTAVYYQTLCGISHTSYPSGEFYIDLDNARSNKLSGLAGIDGVGASTIIGGTTLTTGGWHYVAFVLSGGYIYLYLDGVSDATAVARANSLTANIFRVAAGYSNGSNAGNFAGKLDEVRYSTSGRSADWVATEYNNQNSPSTFYTTGSETSVGGGATTYPRTASASVSNSVSRLAAIVRLATFLRPDSATVSTAAARHPSIVRLARFLRSDSATVSTASSRHPATVRLATFKRLDSATVSNAVSRFATVKRFGQYFRTAAASVSNSTSRLASLIRLTTFKRTDTATVSNSASRFATVKRVAQWIRKSSISVSNSISRLASMVRLTTFKRMDSATTSTAAGRHPSLTRIGQFVRTATASVSNAVTRYISLVRVWASPSYRLTALSRRYQAIRVESATVSNSASRFATVKRFTQYIRKVSASVSNTVSRLATLARKTTFIRKATASVSNYVSRLATVAYNKVSGVTTFVKAVSVSVTRAASRSATVQKAQQLGRHVSATVSNSASRFAILAKTLIPAVATWVRTASVTVSNAASRLASVSRAMRYMRSMAATVSNAAGRFTRIKVLWNGLSDWYHDKFIKQNTGYSDKLSIQGTSYSDKLSKPGNTYTNKFTP